MSLDSVGTALIRRHVGRQLAHLRDKAGLTQEQAAQRLEKGRSTIIRMEDGADNVRFRDIDMKAMLDVYGADPEEATIILALAAETRNGKKKSWWHDYTELPEWFGLYVVLEDSATRIREYESELIPGLLQTREYMETVITTPAAGVTPEQVQQRVQVRVERQGVLTRPNPPRFEAVLNEAVICRPVGEPGLMIGQLEHLLEVGKRPNVSIRILPYAAGAHGGMTAGNSFMLLDFPNDPGGEPIEPPLAYVDTLTGAMYLNKHTEISAYERVWRDIDKKALSAGRSKELITSALEGFRQ
ncbi:helix-turn-helix domain-containing protein [Nocardia salmonicida]|uniref:helix-turn-helix domain-containing protein n=1 Tax=Nocardia salmonicida TaxID=53431 RepID=UPI000B141FB5|nr:helix-turn-helix transcriptional regulator [Nocardia salmonicida]